MHSTLERFYQILSSMNYGILLVTDNNRVEFANQAFCDIFGIERPPAGLVNISANEMIKMIGPAYADPDAAVAHFKEIVRLGRPVMNEEVSMSNGRTLLRDHIPIRIGEKRYGRLWVHKDITDRKHAEEALKESEARYRGLFDNVQEAVAIFRLVHDEEGNAIDRVYVDVNPLTLKLMGDMRQEDVVGKRFSEIVYRQFPNDRASIDRHLSSLAHVAATGVGDTHENRYGDRYYITMQYPIGNGLVGSTSMDITERKRAEESLRTSEQLFRTSVESFSDAFGIYSAVRDENNKIVDFRVDYVNDEACKLNFMTREQQVGHNLIELFPGFGKLSLFQDYVSNGGDGRTIGGGVL